MTCTFTHGLQSVTDIRVVSASSQSTTILGEVRSLCGCACRRVHTVYWLQIKSAEDSVGAGAGQLGAHMILTLASSAPSAILGFVASPAVVKTS